MDWFLIAAASFAGVAVAVFIVALIRLEHRSK